MSKVVLNLKKIDSCVFRMIKFECTNCNLMLLIVYFDSCFCENFSYPINKFRKVDNCVVNMCTVKSA